MDEAAAPPTKLELRAEIAGYADVIFDFDQVRAIVVASGDKIIPNRNLIVVGATEVRFDDATSHGIGVSVLLSIPRRRRGRPVPVP